MDSVFSIRISATAPLASIPLLDFGGLSFMVIYVCGSLIGDVVVDFGRGFVRKQ